MAAKKSDFAEILIRQGTISAEQLAEAKRVAKSSGKKVPDQLVVLGYATGDEVMRAMAKEHGLDFVDLNEVVIPPSVVELVPESVARENAILPMAEEDGALKVIVSDPLRLRHLRKAAVHPQPQGRNRPGAAGEHPRGDQPPLRPDGGPKRRLDAAGIHRHGHRLHRNRAGSRRRRRGHRRDQRPDRAAGAADDHRGGATAGLGHPRRAVRGPGPHPLPHRRRAGRTRQPPPTAAGRPALAHQDSGQDRHRRTPAPPGRADQGHRRREGTRPARQHPADQPRPVGRDAAAGQGQHQGGRPAVGSVGRRFSGSSKT